MIQYSDDFLLVHTHPDKETHQQTEKQSWVKLQKKRQENLLF